MSASVHHVQVPSPADLDGAAMSYIAQGYVISMRDAGSVTLFKRKEFNVLYAVIGFFLCLLPLLIYCIVYATQKDQMVVVHVAGGTALGASTGGAVGTLSPDGRYRWDGQAWQPVNQPGLPAPDDPNQPPPGW